MYFIDTLQIDERVPDDWDDSQREQYMTQDIQHQREKIIRDALAQSGLTVHSDPAAM